MGLVNLNPILKKSASVVWQSIWKNWELFKEGLTWRTGDERLVNSWTDAWLEGSGKLLVFSTITLSDKELSGKVYYFTNLSGGWDFTRIRRVLPPDICEMIRSVPPPNNSNKENRITWMHQKSGFFLVSKAYKLAH
ncbi:hypothetical protein Scep_028186 [Stephania cephalantha]|uniref:Uncharacterized protein n=1 Tax=Stephania cephalantha TaxID=152367 RepID=A0AAP0E9F9_9MAGN